MTASVARRLRLGEEHSMNALPWAAAAAAAAVLIVGRTADRPLGVPHPPLVGEYEPYVHPLVAVAVAAFAAGIALAPRLLALRGLRFDAAALGLALLLRLALAASGAGPGGEGIAAWWKVFDPARSWEAPNEYLPALGALTWGPGVFLDRFAETVPAFPVHVAGHPPGLLLALHALGLDTPGAMAALCIGVGVLGVPLTHRLGRQLLDERRARLAALLLAFAPAAMLFGVTSADALYLTLGLLAAWPLACRTWSARSGGAIVLAVASLFAWSLLAVGAWAAVLALRREGLRAATLLAGLCGAALLALHALAYAATGFDPVGTLRATADVYESGIASTRPYWYWLLGSPVAFLLALGLPIAWYALRAAGSTPGVAIFAVLAVAAALGFTKAETERIWLFFAPFVCLAAATADFPLRPVLAALAVQALAYELLFDTVW